MAGPGNRQVLRVFDPETFNVYELEVEGTRVKSITRVEVKTGEHVGEP
jgi:hypothetical protein